MTALTICMKWAFRFQFNALQSWYRWCVSTRLIFDLRPQMYIEYLCVKEVVYTVCLQSTFLNLYREGSYLWRNTWTGQC